MSVLFLAKCVQWLAPAYTVFIAKVLKIHWNEIRLCDL